MYPITTITGPPRRITAIDFGPDLLTDPPVSLAVSGDKMAAIQRRKTSAAKRNLAGVLVPAVLVVAGVVLAR